MAFAAVIRNTGIQQILVQRHKHFRRWANPAFWFELAGSVATVLMLLLLAPAAGAVFHSPALIGLILVIAAAAPLSPWYVVPSAKLMIDMRFRALAVVNIGYNLAAMAISILLAWWGFGAYSFVIPLPAAGLIRAVWLWRLAKPPVRLRPQTRRWKFLVADSGYLMGTGFLGALILQSGNVALGLFCPKAVVGQFFFAFNLSTQIWQLLAQNLGSVLLPALAKLQEDRPRQVAAFMRASRLLAFVGVPLSLLLAVIAKPVILMVYGSKWLPAVPVLEILAVSMALSLPSSLAYTALQSQGRFRTIFIFNASFLPGLMAAALVGAHLSGAVGVSIGWLAANLFSSPLWVRTFGGTAIDLRSLLGLYLRPLAASAVSLAPAAVAVWWWRGIATQYTTQALLAAASLAVLYTSSAAWFCREELTDLSGQFHRLRAWLFKGGGEN